MGTESASEKLPFHLQGNFAPVHEEKTAFDLEVQGAIPPELRGLYLRNGPNPRSGSSPHWFFGDGMVHGVALADGEAKWYRNRWVRTRPYLEGDETAILIQPDGSVDRTVAKANTNIVGHAGRLLALVESSLPTEMTRELETVGTLRLLRQAHHRHDRPPEALPGDGGDALLRLRVRAALPHLPLRERGGRAGSEPRSSRFRAPR